MQPTTKDASFADNDGRDGWLYQMGVCHCGIVEGWERRNIIGVWP